VGIGMVFRPDPHGARGAITGETLALQAVSLIEKL
jgi:hypothetical protein